jgi:DNA repair exonuclease SbcCD ATPase subunit
MHSISDIVNRKFINSVNLKNLEIETDSGWSPITSIHKTIPYHVWTVKTESGKNLRCADDHILFNDEFNEIFVKDIRLNSFIQTIDGLEKVSDIQASEQEENMFDIAVNSDEHRYYTNGILSHNTTIANALSYGLFGNALTNIKKDNLINKTNGKNMLVTVDFEHGGNHYRIERGRKPTLLKFYVNDVERVDAANNEADESQGDSRETQQEIERILSISPDMFKHIVALNTYTEPFLSLRAADQRSIIEQLLGITLLSEKADHLKEQIKDTKDLITQEQYKIKATEEANARIKEQIESLERRQRLWQNKHEEDKAKLSRSIGDLVNIDIEQELQLHRDLDAYNERKKQIDECKKLIKQSADDKAKLEKAQEKLRKEIASLDNHECYACGQTIHDGKQEEIRRDKQESLTEAETQWNRSDAEEKEHNASLKQLGALGAMPKVFYDTLADALDHKNRLDGLVRDLENKENETDPYVEQIDEMQNKAVIEINYETINQLEMLREHQEFLLKLLTNKDSFVRKRIIDQNLGYLNTRLSQYLERIGLPHTVTFMNDLTVEITELGRELDFDNLSRGERTRLILSLSWAFRDVWESLYQPINLMFIDELIDSGLDSSGVDNALGMLKRMSRELNKSVWLVSHKDELAGRVNNILRVIKENGFTTYETSTEIANI